MKYLILHFISLRWRHKHTKAKKQINARLKERFIPLVAKSQHSSLKTLRTKIEHATQNGAEHFQSLFEYAHNQDLRSIHATITLNKNSATYIAKLIRWVIGTPAPTNSRPCGNFQVQPVLRPQTP